MHAGPGPIFRGKSIAVDYSLGVRNPRILHAQIHGLVRRMEDGWAKEDELLLRIHELVAEHDGLVARLVSRTPETIQFAITRQ